MLLLILLQVVLRQSCWLSLNTLAQRLLWTVCMQAGPCCNNPIFAEIVPAHMRNMVYAFDRHAALIHMHTGHCASVPMCGLHVNLIKFYTWLQVCRTCDSP
jgi:hypothetical protein